MNQTIGHIITRAFSIAGIKKGNIPVEPEEMSDGIDLYNDLIPLLSIDGLNFGATLVTSEDDKTDLPDWARELVKTQLALLLRQEYGRDPDAVLIERSERAWRSAAKQTRDPIRSQYPNTLPKGSGNMNNGRYSSARFYPDRYKGRIRLGNKQFSRDDEGAPLKDGERSQNHVGDRGYQ